MKSQRRSQKQTFELFDVAEPSGNRLVRLEHLFFEEIDRLFRLEVSDPRLQDLSVVSLQLSPDLRNAKVNYALSPSAEKEVSEKEIRAGLEKAMAFLRARLSEALSMKRIPAIHFHRDRLAEASIRAAKVMQTNPSVKADTEEDPA